MAAFGKIAIFIFVVAYIHCTTAEVLSETCTRTERVCDGGSISITCPRGQTILVLHAFYGRTQGAEVCPHPSIADRNCQATNVLQVVKNVCDGRLSCTVSTIGLRDPCANIYKYLVVKYECSN